MQDFGSLLGSKNVCLNGKLTECPKHTGNG